MQNEHAEAQDEYAGTHDDDQEMQDEHETLNEILMELGHEQGMLQPMEDSQIWMHLMKWRIY